MGLDACHASKAAVHWCAEVLLPHSRDAITVAGVAVWLAVWAFSDCGEPGLGERTS